MPNKSWGMHFLSDTDEDVIAISLTQARLT